MIRVPLSEKVMALVYNDGKVDLVNRNDWSDICTFRLESVFSLLYHAEKAGIRMKFRIDPTAWRGIEGA